MPRKSSLLWIAALLTVADVLCLLYLPASLDLVFIDGYEVLVCLIGFAGCALAAKRCAGFERYAWVLAAAYFAALGLGDLSVFGSGIGGGQRVPWLYHALGWSYSLPLALLIFLPWRRPGERWGLRLTLDFAQISLLSGLTFYWLTYLRPDSAYVGNPALITVMRSAGISAGLIVRALADPSGKVRALFSRIAACVSVLTIFQAWLYFASPQMQALPGHPRLYEVVRPLGLLALAIFAVRWNPRDERSADRDSSAYRFAWRLAMTLIPSMGPMVVLSLWIYMPPRSKALAAVALATSFALFLSQLAVAQLKQWRNTAALGAAEDRMRNLSYRLMRAQEDERTRIAGELHDDVGQQMISVLIELEALRQTLGDTEGVLGGQVAKVSATVRAVCDDVRLLSHHLHPATIDILGLIPALGSFCQEFTEHTGIQIEFCHGQLPETLPAEAPICLYRVAQEALRNVQKHSGSSHARLELTATVEAVMLSVADSGNGFAPGSLDHSPGLGMASMAERVRGLGGNFCVESRPGHGTRIQASLPLAARPGGRADARQQPGATSLSEDYIDPPRIAKGQA